MTLVLFCGKSWTLFKREPNPYNDDIQHHRHHLHEKSFVSHTGTYVPYRMVPKIEARMTREREPLTA
jgi:hypothetical protein